MDIELLANHAESIPTLADWYVSEWEPYYGVSGHGDARADLESRCNRDEIPIGFVVIEGGEIYGTAALGDLLVLMGWYSLGEVQFLNKEQGSVYARDL